MTVRPDEPALAALRSTLHQALSNMEGLDGCALLEWPRRTPNIGSHLAWIATGLYVEQTAGGRIAYVATIESFSAEAMRRRIGRGAILLRGGYFGDFWGENPRQLLYERVIAECQNHEVYLMPQSIRFDDPKRLARTAAILNAHPRLTVFARDAGSLAFTQELFPKTRVVLAPDTALHLLGFRGLPRHSPRRNGCFYLWRSDWQQREFAPERLGIPDLEAGEWPSFDWVGVGRWPRFTRIPGAGSVYREVWQRGLATPREWLARRRWMRICPAQQQHGQAVPDWLRPTWSWIHSCLWHLSRFQVVITNRLHGHIACLLLGIPHVLVPGPYDKMRAFHTTWTHGVSFCRLVEEPSVLTLAVEELLAAEQRVAA